MASDGPSEPAAKRHRSWPAAVVTELVAPETSRASWVIRGYSQLQKTRYVARKSPTIVEVAGARFFVVAYFGGIESCPTGSFSLFCGREVDDAPVAAPVSAKVKIVVVDQDQSDRDIECLLGHSFGPQSSQNPVGRIAFGTVQQLEERVKDDTLVIGLEVTAWAPIKEREWKLPAPPTASAGAAAAGTGDQKRASLAKDFGALLSSGLGADVEVSGSLCEAGEQAMKAHRNVLAARSPVFSRMLESGMRESQADAKLSLDGADRAITERFVRFLYTDELDQESLDSPDALCHLLSLGHRFEVQSLMQLCTARLAITDDTAVDRLVMAEQLNLASMKEQVVSFVCSCRERLKKIQKSDAFARMSRNYPQLVVELFDRAT